MNNAEKHLTDAMNTSYNNISDMLDKNESDEKLKKELDLFDKMLSETKKYHIPYSLQK